MARGWIAAGSVILALVVAVGTALYVRGIAPPFPWNMHAFGILLAVCIAWALAFGRASR